MSCLAIQEKSNNEFDTFHSTGAIFPGLVLKLGLGIVTPRYLVVVGSGDGFRSAKAFEVITPETKKIVCYDVSSNPNKNTKFQNFNRFEIEVLGLNALTNLLLCNPNIFIPLSIHAKRVWGMTSNDLLNQVALCFSLHYPNYSNPYLIYKNYGLVDNAILGLDQSIQKSK